LLFCDDWKENFGYIFGHPKALPPNPSLYLCRSSASDDTVAPEGKDNMFVLVPAPNGIYPSDGEIFQYKNRIYETILRYTGIDLRPHLIVEEVFTAKDFQTRYNARNGTAL
jgi:phytoene desaturase